MGSFPSDHPSQHNPSRHNPSRHNLSRHNPSRHNLSRHNPSQHTPPRHNPSRHHTMPRPSKAKTARRANLEAGRSKAEPIAAQPATAKRIARQECDYSYRSLCERVPRILDDVALVQIRRFARKAWRYIESYANGLNANEAEEAQKKYKSHRRIRKDD